MAACGSDRCDLKHSEKIERIAHTLDTDPLADMAINLRPAIQPPPAAAIRVAHP